ncbi:cytochrome d ubiquinol oxidase subunit II [Catellatospora sp. NPDC049133]|uniref:cytochrome d ubiquinol oxidase subunit II n=1 Tax=Catellatospora sp. NPDC049133 TaxID=3155499 RepID=UPI00340913BE
MELTTIWFILIAILWTGYFVLEGFDFGVGMLLPILGRGFSAQGERERRVLINTIGPVWDGNEVWVLTAGGATFAAFPEWYATLFSGFYLPLLLILVALIIRGVAFEYRGKRDDLRWRRRFDICIVVGSAVPALLWGVAFGNIFRGVRLGPGHEYAGSFGDLLNPYALLGGTTTLALFLLHGAIFLTLKTSGNVRDHARRVAGTVGPVAALIAVTFLLFTFDIRRTPASITLGLLAAASLLASLVLVRTGTARTKRDGWAFAGTAACLVLTVASLFSGLYPYVMPSTTADVFSLTVTNASSTPYTLKIMTWVAVVFTPVVVAYQGWTYWVFRKRISITHIPPASEPHPLNVGRLAVDGEAVR